MSATIEATEATDRTPPTYLSLIVKNLPIDDLAPYPHAVTWNPEWREGKNSKPGGWTKVLKNPRTGLNAKSNDPRTWGAAGEVLGRYDRFGFVVADDDPFGFLDLDNAVDPATGEIKPWAWEIIRLFSTYWEYSPSGTGLKCWIRATAARNRIIPIGDGKVELFFTGKFSTLTGHRVEGTPATITDCQAALDHFLAEHCAEPKPPTAAPPSTPLPELDLDDKAIIANGRKMAGFGPLYDRGDLSAYDDDHSRADLGLLNYFVAAGGAGEAQLARLFDTSALGKRDKWKDRSDYRERTIAKALDSTVQPYNWNPGLTSTTSRAGTRRAISSATAGNPQDAGTGDDCAGVRDELATLRAENAALRRQLAERDATIVALTQTILNPHLSHTEKVAAVSIARHADAKRAGGQVEPDGRVVLSASEVADDWRPKPEPGEHIAPVNPDSGTAPHMPRSSARSVLDAALERELVQGEKRGTLRHRADGSTYKDWEYVVSPAASFADLLNPWAGWRPDAPKIRKVRESRACPHCGEVHPITRVDYCGGCNKEISRQTIAQPDAGENISPIAAVVDRHGRKTFSHSTPPAESPRLAKWRAQFVRNADDVQAHEQDRQNEPDNVAGTVGRPEKQPLFPPDETPAGQSHHFQVGD
jgi:hypothetical protein